MPRLRKNEYARVPETQLTTLQWHIPDMGTLRVVPGHSHALMQVDQEFLDSEPPDDDSAFWKFHELGLKREREERFVVMEDDRGAIAAWLDHHQLVNGDAYRLDFFKVRPHLQRKGLGRFVLGLIGMRAMEKKAERIVFQPLPRSRDFYLKVGATTATDWRGGDGSLPNFQIGAGAIQELKGVADGYRIKG
jgi:GNAT superfamily N-acetyltransferase